MILKMKLNIIPALLFLLQSCEANPPSLAGDTLVNTLLSQNSKHAGLRRLEKDSELIREHPPGSGRGGRKKATVMWKRPVIIRHTNLDFCC